MLLIMQLVLLTAMRVTNTLLGTLSVMVIENFW